MPRRGMIAIVALGIREKEKWENKMFSQSKNSVDSIVHLGRSGRWNYTMLMITFS